MTGAGFSVRFTFRTAVAVGQIGLLPSLDSLIAGALMQAAGQPTPDPLGEPPVLDLPLDRLAPDLWAATQLWPLRSPADPAAPATLPDPVGDAARVYVRRYDHPSLDKKPKDAGPTVQKMRRVQTVFVRHAVAFGRGDAAAVSAALRTLTAIGRERALGFGRLAAPPSVRRWDPARPLPLIQDERGRLRRIVSLREAPALRLDPNDPSLQAYISLGSTRLPLWYRPWWEPCLIPLPITTRQFTEVAADVS